MIDEQESIDDVETLLMTEYPSIYVAMLKATGREDEVEDDENWKGWTNYTDKILKDYLAILKFILAKSNDKLHRGKTPDSS